MELVGDGFCPFGACGNQLPALPLKAQIQVLSVPIFWSLQLCEGSQGLVHSQPYELMFWRLIPTCGNLKIGFQKHTSQVEAGWPNVHHRLSGPRKKEKFCAVLLACVHLTQQRMSLWEGQISRETLQFKPDFTQSPLKSVSFSYNLRESSTFVSYKVEAAAQMQGCLLERYQSDGTRRKILPILAYDLPDREISKTIPTSFLL